MLNNHQAQKYLHTLIIDRIKEAVLSAILNKMECFDDIYFIRLILNAIFTILGVGGNVLTSVVLLSKMRRNVPNILLVSLAIVNSIYLLCTCSLRVLVYLKSYSSMNQTSIILVKLAFFISEWILVLLCLCRYNAYRYPQYVDKIWKPCNVAVMLLGICLASFVTNLKDMIEAGKDNNSTDSVDDAAELPVASMMDFSNNATTINITQNDSTVDSTSSKWSRDELFHVDRYDLVYHTIITGLLPVVIMLHCSIVMYRWLKQSGIEVPSHDDMTRDFMKKMDDCSKIVLVLVTPFIACLILYVSHYVYLYLQSSEMLIGEEHYCIAAANFQIIFSMLEISASIEFYVFLMLRREFRVEVSKALRCKWSMTWDVFNWQHKSPTF